MAGEALPKCGEHQGKCDRCGVEIHAKARQTFKGEARRKRKTISIKVPNDAGEDGAGVLTDLIETLEERISGATEEKARPPYFTLVDGMNYAVLNSDHTDFAKD